MGSSTPKETTTKTVTEMSPEQRELYQIAAPGVRQFAAQPLRRYSGQTIAGFDPNQVAGQESVLGAAGAQDELARNAAKSSNFWTGASGNPWDPSTNQMLQSATDAATRPIVNNLLRSALPAIRGGAVTSGNFGSSRQGIAEGLATGEAAQAVGDTAAKLAQSTYDTNVGAQMKALGLAPQTQQAQLAGGLSRSGVGDIRQAMAQRLLDEGAHNFNFDQMAPLLQSKEILSLITGIPGGTSTSTGTLPQPSALSQGVGGAVSGASLGSMFGPMGMVAGGGIGALLPFLLK